MADPGSPVPFGSITDVDGVHVGHAERIGGGWLTGSTVVFVPDGAVAGVDVRGGGPGTRETDALHPSHLVERVHAVCLSGGSAFGLAAADGVMGWLEARGLGFPIDDEHVVPVVPAAVIFDLGRGGDFARRPGAELGRAAIESAGPDPAYGAVGAGTGARTAGLQGGVGTASIAVGDLTVGALAVVNAAGSPVDPDTGALWRHPPGAPPPTPAERDALVDAARPSDEDSGTGPAPDPPLNTTIGVVATSARLTPAEATKLAAVAHDGLAHAIRPAHSMFDGDTVFALATGAVELPDVPPRFRGAATRAGTFNAVLAAAADAFALACSHAVLAATPIADAPSYRALALSVDRWWRAGPPPSPRPSRPSRPARTGRSRRRAPTSGLRPQRVDRSSLRT
jgi:L-aminopeptidase/D-esterase-like protein